MTYSVVIRDIRGDADRDALREILKSYDIDASRVEMLLQGKHRVALTGASEEVFRILCAWRVEDSFSIVFSGVAGGSAPCLLERHVTPPAV